MIASFSDLARYLDEQGWPHRVRPDAACIDVPTREGRLTLCWDQAHGRLYAIRWDEDDARPALRLSVPLPATGGLREVAVARLVLAAMPRGVVALRA